MAATRRRKAQRGGDNATNVRDQFLRDFKQEFKENLVSMLKRARMYGRDLPSSEKELRTEVKKVYMSTDMHEHVDAEEMRDEVIAVAVESLKPIIAKLKAAEERRANEPPQNSRIKRKFLKGSFLSGYTHRANRITPRKTIARGLTLSKNTMSMGALSRALNDLF
jgi:hypothetical protein